MRKKMVAFPVINFLADSLYEDTGRVIEFTKDNKFRDKQIGSEKVYCLRQDFVVDGVTLKEGSMFIYVDLKDDKNTQYLVVFCVKKQMLGEDQIPLKSSLWFRRDSLNDLHLDEVRLSKDATIDGKKFKSKSIVYFYNSKAIYSGVLAENTKVKGFSFMLKADTSVDFHENGDLCEGRIAETTILNGISFAPGTLVVFNKDGILDNVELQEDTVVDGHMFQRNSTLSFHPNGKVSIGMLAMQENIQGISFPKLTDVFFDENGKCIKAEVVELVFKHEGKIYPLMFEDVEISGVKIKLEKKVDPYIVVKSFTYKGVTFPIGSICFFDKDNRVESILVEKEIWLGSKKYPLPEHSSVEVYFKIDGTPWVPK